MLECQMESETRRLSKLKDTSRNLAKRYKLPEAASGLLRKLGRFTDSKAVQYR